MCWPKISRKFLSSKWNRHHRSKEVCFAAIPLSPLKNSSPFKFNSSSVTGQKEENLGGEEAKRETIKHTIQSNFHGNVLFMNTCWSRRGKKSTINTTNINQTRLNWDIGRKKIIVGALIRLRNKFLTVFNLRADQTHTSTAAFCFW